MPTLYKTYIGADQMRTKLNTTTSFKPQRRSLLRDVVGMTF